jgi:hypothetical protein
MQKQFSLAVPLAALLVLTGCTGRHAAPVEPKVEMIERSIAPEGNRFASVLDGDVDPDRMPSRSRWEASYSRKYNHRVASIMAESNDQIIQLVCYPRDFFIQILPRRQLSSPPESRRIAFAFDDGPLTEQSLKAKQLSKSDWYFGGGKEDAGFRALLRDLKTHREFTTVIIESGEEVMRERFTLAGAAEAIDFVLQSCGGQT